MDTQLYEQLKRALSEQGRQMRQINTVVPVSGTRYDLPTGERSINVVYYPAEEEKRPLLICFHGGGFIFGGNAMDDAMWCALRDGLHMNVASIEYRKSPDHTWRYGLEDAYDAACYLKEHAADFGFDASSISVFGSSSGANIAATLCIYLLQKGKMFFKNQLLMYPYIDLVTDPAEKNPEVDPTEQIFNDLHCPDPEERTLPIVSPVMAAKEDLSGLPNTVIVVAEKDHLNKEGIQYKKMLEDAGVPVSLMIAKEMPHIFFDMGFKEANEEELSHMPPEVGEAVHSGKVHEAAAEALEFYCTHLV